MKKRVLINCAVLLGLMGLGFLIAFDLPEDRFIGTPLISGAPPAGYVWFDPGDAGRGVRWSRGLRNASVPHVVSADREGYWFAEPGYKFPVPGTLTTPRWVAGKAHPTAPHVRSGKVEQQWAPELGYIFVSKTPDDLRVELMKPKLSKLSWAAELSKGERFALTILTQFVGAAIIVATRKKP